MAWQRGGKTRTSDPAWRKVRLVVLVRDHRRCFQCGKPGNRVDHIVRPDEGGTDHPSNLRVICQACDGKRAAEQGNEVRWAKHRAMARRPEEPHPGRIG